MNNNTTVLKLFWAGDGIKPRRAKCAIHNRPLFKIINKGVGKIRCPHVECGEDNGKLKHLL